MRWNNILVSCISITLMIMLPIGLLPSVLGAELSLAEPKVVYALLNKADKPVLIDFQVNGTRMAGKLQIIAHPDMQLLISIQGIYPPSTFDAASVNSIPISLSVAPLPPAETIAPWIKINTPLVMNVVKGENNYTGLIITVGSITEDWQYSEFMLQAEYIDPMSGENITSSMTIAVTTHIEETNHHVIPRQNSTNPSINTPSTTTTIAGAATTTVTGSETISRSEVATEDNNTIRGLNLIAASATILGVFILLLLFALRRRMIV